MKYRFRFRAKRIDNNEFIYGFLCFIIRDVCRIYCSREDKFYDCATKTLGQCTGLKDKNGRLIYEGDILKLPWQAGWQPIVGVVKFNTQYACFLLAKNETKEAYKSFWWNDGKEVVGNIHENPELLENTDAKH